MCGDVIAASSSGRAGMPYPRLVGAQPGFRLQSFDPEALSISVALLCVNFEGRDGSGDFKNLRFLEIIWFFFILFYFK